MDAIASRPSPQLPSYVPPVAVGHVLRGRYKLLHCIARQRFSAVWLAKDSRDERYVALKIQSPSKPVPPCGCVDVANLLAGPKKAPPGVPILLDSFTLQSASGKPGPKCTVTPLLGQPISVLFRPKTTVMPWNIVKQVTVSVLVALHYLHTIKGVVHTDIHPNNILILPSKEAEVSTVEAFLSSNDPRDDEVGPVPFPPCNDVDELSVMLIDLETAHLDCNRDSHDFLIQPHHLRAPEVILGAKWGPPVDIWNLGCLIVEWTTGGSLFQYDTDTWNPQQILEHMVRAFGHFPPELIAKGRFASKWFNADGTLKAPPELVGLSLEGLLLYYLEKSPGYESLRSQVDDREIGSYIDCVSLMLRLNPDERWRAKDLVGHPWLRPSLQRMHDAIRRKQLNPPAPAKVTAVGVKNPYEDMGHQRRMQTVR